METAFNGRVYRSQLEARWAAYFTLMGWEFDYEPALDLNGWLPDFILYASKYNGGENGEEIQHKILVEVKPYSTLGEFTSTQAKIEKSIKGTDWEQSEILLLGSSVFKSNVYANNDPAYGIIGWFSQIDNQPLRGGNPKRITDEAYPISLHLDRGNSYDLTDSQMFSRFQGYWDHCYGSSYSFDWAHPLDYPELKEVWDKAGNEVRWKKQKTVAKI
jgi:hypothetical protein